MDPKRRAVLIERRNRLRRALQLQQQPIELGGRREALSAAGAEFEILRLGEVSPWTPSWIPRGYSRIPWELVAAAETTRFDDDLDIRDAAIVSALTRLADPHEILLLVFEGQGASLRITRDVAERYVRIILGNYANSPSPIWITSPPRQWLIELSFDHVRVGDTLAAGNVGGDLNGQAAVLMLCRALDKNRSPYILFHHDDLQRPELPNIAYDRPIPPLRKTVPAADEQRVRAIVLGFIGERVSSSDPVQLILAGATRLQLSFAAFTSLFDMLYSSAADFNVSGPAAGWVVCVRRRTQTWIEGHGSRG